MGPRPKSISAAIACVTMLMLATATYADGPTLYAALCASCHGAEGRGDGVVANETLLRPRDFALNAFKFDTDADWERGTDIDLANVIKNGPAIYGGSQRMPPWNSLSDDDVSALVAHIRHLQRLQPKAGGG